MKKRMFAIMLALMLALGVGLMFAGCSGDTTDPGTGTGNVPPGVFANPPATATAMAAALRAEGWAVFYEAFDDGIELFAVRYFVDGIRLTLPDGYLGDIDFNIEEFPYHDIENWPYYDGNYTDWNAWQDARDAWYDAQWDAIEWPDNPLEDLAPTAVLTQEIFSVLFLTSEAAAIEEFGYLEEDFEEFEEGKEELAELGITFLMEISRSGSIVLQWISYSGLWSAFDNL